MEKSRMCTVDLSNLCTSVGCSFFTQDIFFHRTIDSMLRPSLICSSDIAMKRNTVDGGRIYASSSNHGRVIARKQTFVQCMYSEKVSTLKYKYRGYLCCCAYRYVWSCLTFHIAILIQSTSVTAASRRDVVLHMGGMAAAGLMILDSLSATGPAVAGLASYNITGKEIQEVCHTAMNID